MDDIWSRLRSLLFVVWNIRPTVVIPLFLTQGTLSALNNYCMQPSKSNKKCDLTKWKNKFLYSENSNDDAHNHIVDKSLCIDFQTILLEELRFAMVDGLKTRIWNTYFENSNSTRWDPQQKSFIPNYNIRNDIKK